MFIDAYSLVIRWTDREEEIERKRERESGREREREREGVLQERKMSIFFERWVR